MRTYRNYSVLKVSEGHLAACSWEKFLQPPPRTPCRGLRAALRGHCPGLPREMLGENDPCWGKNDLCWRKMTGAVCWAPICQQNWATSPQTPWESSSGFSLLVASPPVQCFLCGPGFIRAAVPARNQGPFTHMWEMRGLLG